MDHHYLKVYGSLISFSPVLKISFSKFPYSLQTSIVLDCLPLHRWLCLWLSLDWNYFKVLPPPLETYSSNQFFLVLIPLSDSVTTNLILKLVLCDSIPFPLIIVYLFNISNFLWKILDSHLCSSLFLICNNH